MNDDPGSPDSRRSLATGVDKIKIIGYDKNFGRIQISILSNVVSGNNYSYQPDGSFQSLGVSFQNRINIPEVLLSNNPNQSNDSYISVINQKQILLKELFTLKILKLAVELLLMDISK